MNQIKGGQKLQIQKPIPVNQQIYDFLFKQILEGSMPAGTRLAEEKIATQLGVSRTPVRESILRLEQEGLVRNKFVIEPTLKEIQDCYEVRILLESYAARKAAQTMTEQEKKQLSELVNHADPNNFESIMRMHTEFHQTIVRAAENDQISQLIERMHAIILLCRKDIVRNRQALPHEHDAIYHAILQGDGEQAEHLMKQHLNANFESMICHIPATENRTVNPA